MQEKILTFVVNEGGKFLLLLGSDKDPQFHKSFWYVITGAKEEIDNTLEETVRRETKEETNLELDKVINLNRTYQYESLGKQCIEHVFLSYTKDKNIKLNEESIDYAWLFLEEFIEKIYWHYDKKELKKWLEKEVEKRWRKTLF